MTGDQLKDFEREIWLSHIHATVEDMQRPVSLTALLRCHILVFIHISILWLSDQYFYNACSARCVYAFVLYNIFFRYEFCPDNN